MAAGEDNISSNANNASGGNTNTNTKPKQEKQYDYLLKFLLVGDSDVGKQEILSGLEDGAFESPFCSGNGIKNCNLIIIFVNLYAYFSL